METKKGACAIICDIKAGRRYFLLLHRSLNWRGWEFPKGGMDEGESAEEAVLREAGEEAGLRQLEIAKKLDARLKWVADKNYDYTVFILKGKMGEKINLQQGIAEHDAFRWVLESEVEEMLSYKENKAIFRQALKELGKEAKHGREKA